MPLAHFKVVFYLMGKSCKSKLLKTPVKTGASDIMPMWKFTKWSVVCILWDLCATKWHPSYVACKCRGVLRFGGGPFVLEFIEFPQWTRNFRPPRARTFSILPLQIGFFRLKTPGHFRDFLGDHFTRVESSGNPNLTMFILDFHVFLHFWPPKIMKIQGFAKPFKTPSPGTMPRW